MRLIDHPGTAPPERAIARPCRVVPVQITLRKGQTLTQAIQDGFAAAGFRYGYLRLDSVDLAPLSYVMPAPAPGDGHAAWYSAPRTRPAARITHGGAHLGQRDGAAFIHCHALTAQGEMGHILCDDSQIAQDITVQGWGLQRAGLIAQDDAETRFTLFRPQTVAEPGPETGQRAHLITLRPNQDITTALEAIARTHSITKARIEGIGSLVGTQFTNAADLDSYATEILLINARIEQGRAEVELASVGFDGKSQRGHAARGQNAICVTAEILLIETD